MIGYERFCRLKQAAAAGRTAPQIACELALHVQTVRKWLERERYERSRGAQQTRRSKLDPYKPVLVRLLDTHPFTAMQLFHRLREQGYDGGYSIVKDHVRRIRPTTSEAFLTLKFAPGQCAQVDWGSFGTVPVDGTRRALSFFALVLGHSRWLHVEFTLGQSQEWFLGCHQRAFEKLGGVPHEVMVDNCKTAVLSHLPGAEPVYNAQYLDFARHYGFRIKACGPGHPQSKGIVENAVAYVKKSFLAGRTINAFAELAPAVSLWLETIANVRLHAETRARPLDLLALERPHLLPLNPQPYPAVQTRTVRASRRCRVTVDTNRYSVPPRWAGALLTAQLSSDHVRLYADTTLVAEHRRSYGRRDDREDPDHVRRLEAEKRHGARQRLLLRFLELTPAAGPYHRALAERRMNAGHHLARILELLPTYGAAALAAAIENAHQLGAYSSDYIINLLGARARRLPEPGPLHLTHATDALQLELCAPDLTPYTDEQHPVL
ncbi:MAG TPA: IS21 family transposase [Burkholderiales bacterium]|nr:IS21 family transposase [Burkholderiales bacterium]